MTVPGFDPGMLRLSSEGDTTKPLRAVFKVDKNLGYLFDIENIISCESRPHAHCTTLKITQSQRFTLESAPKRAQE